MSEWKKCSSCKIPIEHGAKYFVCSVSTCNGKRTGYVFCSIPCFEVHLPGARHKDAAAIEEKAPAPGAASAGGTIPKPVTLNSSSPSSGQRRMVTRPGGEQSAATSLNSAPKDILIVASKLKDYVRNRSGMNTSASVMEALSDKVRALCDDAIMHAESEGRKTVMDKDF